MLPTWGLREGHWRGGVSFLDNGLDFGQLEGGCWSTTRVGRPREGPATWWHLWDRQRHQRLRLGLRLDLVTGRVHDILRTVMSPFSEECGPLRKRVDLALRGVGTPDLGGAIIGGSNAPRCGQLRAFWLPCARVRAFHMAAGRVHTDDSRQDRQCQRPSLDFIAGMVIPDRATGGAADARERLVCFPEPTLLPSWHRIRDQLGGLILRQQGQASTRLTGGVRVRRPPRLSGWLAPRNSPRP